MKDLAPATLFVRKSSTLTLSIFLSALLLIVSSASNIKAAPADLDPSFGSGGKVMTDLGNAANEIDAIALQPDGKIVIAGSVGSPFVGNTASYFGLARYNSNGTLDSSFGAGGKVITDITADVDVPASAFILPDNKILVAGYSFASGSGTLVVRYNSDGTLDTSFDGDGKAIYNLGLCFAAALQTDGRLVLVGSNFNVSRINSDGTVDTNFGSGGTALTNFGANSHDTNAYAVALQSDSRIVVAGTTAIGGSGTDFALARLNADGSPDLSFDTDGKVLTNFNLDDVARSLVIQPDGKIIAAGFGHTGTTFDYDFVIARYNINGGLDTTFDGDGKVSTDFGHNQDRALAVALQRNGKIVVTGQVISTDATPQDDFGIARYNSNGSLDTTFDTDGKLTLDFFGFADLPRTLAIQPDGKILVGGFATASENANADFALVRYLGDQVFINGNVLISEFRLAGPNNNPSNEFIEFYNNTDAPITVSTQDGSSGWSLVNSSDVQPTRQNKFSASMERASLNSSAQSITILTIPNGIVIPARGHYLAINSNGYSLTGAYAAGDISYIPDIAETGIALFSTSNPANFLPANILDAVGFTGATLPFYEGTALTPTPAPQSEFSFVRKQSVDATHFSGINDRPQDTNNNAADFVIVSVTGTVGTLQVALGAPGPENLASPIVKSNSSVNASYIDPMQPQTAPPNRVRNGSGSGGTLSIRRKFTNRTGAPLTRLRFRIVDITTLNNTDGLPAPVADLRAITSSDTPLTLTNGTMITVNGLTMERVVVGQSEGGLNSSLSADTVTMQTPLAPNDAINVQFVLSVAQAGRFSFFVVVEALP